MKDRDSSKQEGQIFTENCVIDDNPPSQKHNGWHCCDLQLQGLRSRVFYYSRNSLLHTWIAYYTELPMKVPTTPHHLENRYYVPPPIAITGNRLTCLSLQSVHRARIPEEQPNYYVQGMSGSGRFIQGNFRQSHIRDVTEDPYLGTDSKWGFLDSLLLINIFHIQGNQISQSHMTHFSSLDLCCRTTNLRHWRHSRCWYQPHRYACRHILFTDHNPHRALYHSITQYWDTHTCPSH